MFIIDKQKNEVYSLPAKEISAEHAKSVGSELAQRILSLLAKESMYPIYIAKSLKVHEQKIYYHIRNLEKAGLIKVAKKEGLPIPPPVTSRHGARLNLRLPKDIVDRLKRDATDHAMSLNQYVLWRLAS